MKKTGGSSNRAYPNSSGSLHLIALCKMLLRSIMLAYCIQNCAIFPFQPDRVSVT